MILKINCMIRGNGDDRGNNVGIYNEVANRDWEQRVCQPLAWLTYFPLLAGMILLPLLGSGLNFSLQN